MTPLEVRGVLELLDYVLGQVREEFVVELGKMVDE